MTYNISKINEIAQNLHLSNLVDTINCAIEGLKKCNEQVTMLVVTTHNIVGKAFLKECLGLSFGSTNRLYPCSIEFLSGNDEEYVVETEMGKINIDESTLIKQLSSKETNNLQAKVTKPFLFNKLVRLNFLYVNDFADFSHNEWIYKLASTDKFYLLLDGLQIFNDKEKNFAEELINSMFSSSRCAFLIGNTKFLNDSERAEIMEYSVSLVEKDSSIMYFTADSFKKDIDEKVQIDEMRKEFLSHVSHELKTPLAVVSSQVEMLEIAGDKIDRSYYYSSIHEELDKMSKMVGELLDFSMLDNQMSAMEMSRVNVSEMAEYLLLRYDLFHIRIRLLYHGFLYSGKLHPGFFRMPDPQPSRQAFLPEQLLRSVCHFHNPPEAFRGRVLLTVQKFCH